MKNWSFCKKKLLFSIFPTSATLPHIYEHGHKIDFILSILIGICKVYLKTVKRSDMAILCGHCDNWIYVKCSNLDKLGYEMLKSTA